MSDKERTGKRDLLYSTWHRKQSFTRYMSAKEAAMVEMIDIDHAEACPFCHKTLALNESKNSLRSPKEFSSRNTANLARQAGIPAFVTTYVCVCGVIGESHETREGCDIASLQLQQVAPLVGEVIPQSPEQHATWLLQLRSTCGCLKGAVA